MKQELYQKLVAYIVEHQNACYRLAFSYVRDQDDALDIVQNAVCKALEHYGSLKNEDAIKTWFYRIVINESLLYLRQKKREMPAGESQMVEGIYEEPGYEPPEESLYQLIYRLEPEAQQIVRLRFFEELSLKEIAEVMDMNLSTVKAKLYRSLKSLKKMMQEVGA